MPTVDTTACGVVRIRSAYPVFNPAAFTTGAQRATSSCMKAVTFSGLELVIGSRPCSISAFCIAGSFITLCEAW